MLTKIRTLVLLVLMGSALPLMAQATDVAEPDSLRSDETVTALAGFPPPPEVEKNNGLMAIDMAFLTVGVWLPSRLMGTDWAYIGANTIKENMKTGFVWDHDDWAMNQWGHPLHGGQFFNAARTNGYDFWGSIPITMASSMTWELFMEAEPPSINDLISTTVGGVYMGETAYRISSMILDNTATGSERTFREIGAFFVNPIRGFNRLVTGKTSGAGLNPEDRMPDSLGGHLSLGTNRVADGTDLGNAENAFLFKGSFLYGALFDDLADPDPFDYFSIRAVLNLYGKFPFIHEVTGTGLLFGRKFDHGQDNRSLYGVFQDYDFFDNKVYQFGGQSVGGGIFSNFNADSPLQVLTGAQLNWVILGGANVGFETAKGREYNYNTGAKLKLFGMLDHKKYGAFALRYWIYWFHTISGIDGNEYIHWAQAQLNPRIYKKWGLGLEYTYYMRDSYLHGYPESHLNNVELRTYVSYRF